MFLRFTKGQFDSNNVRKFRKCVFLGGSLVMEYGDKIVGAARLHEETDKCFDYDVVVAKDCEIGAKVIARTNAPENEIAFTTGSISVSESDKAIAELEKNGISVKSKIRISDL